MSIYSEQLDGANLSQHLTNQNKPYEPKYMKQDSGSQRDSITNSQTNKLPLNLFLTPSQYNKMLVTYGKNRKKQISHISEGFVTNLQFVNDHIFQKINQERAFARLTIQSQPKFSKTTMEQCTCCCCEQYCEQCSIKRRNCDKISATDVKKALNQIDQRISLAIKGSRKSINSSQKKSKSHQKIHQSFRTQNILSQSQNKKQNLAHQDFLNHSQNKQGADISHLVIRSLIEFEQNRMKEAFLKKQNVDNKKAKQQYLKLLNTQIRSENLKASRLSCNLPKQKTLSKSEISKEYWNQIKQDVKKNLKDDNYSATLIKKLKRYDFNVYEHNDFSKKQIKLSKEQIKMLRQKHQEEVKRQIDKKIKEKLQKNNKIKNNLKSLEKQRISHIRSTSKSPFKPTQEMIEFAFKNIIQPKKVVVKQDQRKTNRSKRQEVKYQSKKKL